jgi:hypothetical protein
LSHVAGAIIRQWSSNPLRIIGKIYVGTVTVASGTTLNIEKVGTIYFEDTTTKLVMALKEYHCVP